MAAAEWICVGALTRPHGIRGELRLDLYAEDEGILDAPLQLEAGKMPKRPVRIAKARPDRGAWIVSLEGVTGRNQAEVLKGATLWVARADLPELEEDEAYIADLLGAPVVLPDNTEVGILDHIETPPGQMLWAIHGSGYEYLFPARPEFIVRFEEDRIVIDPPEGLLETCRTELRRN